MVFRAQVHQATPEMLGVRSSDFHINLIRLCRCRAFSMLIFKTVSNSSIFNYNSLLFRNRFTQTSYYAFIVQLIYVGKYLFHTNCTSLGIYAYCCFSYIFRLIITVIFRETVDSKKHFMMKQIVVNRNW
jgi:hypothetical protein